MSFRLGRSFFSYFSPVLLAACGNGLAPGDEIPGGSGGALATGGAWATGGGSASGGAQSGGGPAVGGSTAAGGDAATGGGSASGGVAAGGGSNSSGGTASGGGAAAGGASGGDGSGGGTSVDPCPPGMTFCSGFEENALPEGAVFKLNGDPATPWTKYFEVDASVKRGGASSLRVKSVAEVSDAYKMLSVPSGGANFWVRLYIRSDVELGSSEHNVFGQASGSDEPNDGTSVEFAEDVGLSFNSQDVVRWPEGFGRLNGGGTMPFTLPKDEWHCIELHFDGTTRVQELYIEGEQKIAAPDYPAATKAFTRFKFGYNALHFTERKVWYDDVAVGPTRPGCLD